MPSRPRTQATARNARQAGLQVINAGPIAHALTVLALRLTPSTLWARLVPRHVRFPMGLDTPAPASDA
jgi:hypothetical protein